MKKELAPQRNNEYNAQCRTHITTRLHKRHWIQHARNTILFLAPKKKKQIKILYHVVYVNDWMDMLYKMRLSGVLSPFHTKIFLLYSRCWIEFEQRSQTINVSFALLINQSLFDIHQHSWYYYRVWSILLVTFDISSPLCVRVWVGEGELAITSASKLRADSFQRNAFNRRNFFFFHWLNDIQLNFMFINRKSENSAHP